MFNRIVRRSRAVLLGVALASLPAWSSGQDAPSPEAMQLRAYTSIMEAERARDAGQHGLAVRRFREALISYNALAGAYPDFRPDIVAHRLQTTREAIRQISEATGRTEEELAAEGVRIEAVGRMPPERVAEAMEENVRLRQRVAELEAEVEAGPRLPPGERAMIETMAENLSKLAAGLQEARRQDRAATQELVQLARAADQGSRDMARLLGQLRESVAASPLSPEQMAEWFAEAEAKVQGRLSEQARALNAAAETERTLRSEAEALRAEVARREQAAADRLEEIEALQAALTAQRQDADVALREVRQDVAQLEARLAEIQDQGEDWTRERDRLQQEVTRATRQIAYLEEEMKIIEDAYARIGQRALDVETRNRQLEARLAELGAPAQTDPPPEPAPTPSPGEQSEEPDADEADDEPSGPDVPR